MSQKNHDNQSSRVSDRQRPTERTVRISARQRNHEEYRLPSSLSHLPPMPLYLAVAHYVLLAQEPVSRQAISAAFFISTRRALEVMRYLINAKGVVCTRLPPQPALREQGYLIQVEAISIERGQFRGRRQSSSAVSKQHEDMATSKPRSRREKERACQDIRRQFLLWTAEDK